LEGNGTAPIESRDAGDGGRPTSPALLALAGLLSAVLDGLVPEDWVVGRWSTGLVFGCGLWVYFAAFERRRGVLRLVALAGACTVAWPLAQYFALHALMTLHRLGWIASHGAAIPLPVFFAGGLCGGACVIGAGLPLLTGGAGRKLLDLAALGALSGGVLGALAGAAYETHADTVLNESSLLYLIWQPSTAWVLGALLQWGHSRRDRP
jgi:hypothetical protein